MNFLALVANVFTQQQEAPKSSSSSSVALAIPKPITNNQQFPPQTIPQQTMGYTPKPRVHRGLEAKRIQRLRALADLGAYGNSRIEGMQVNGMWAQIALQVYDRESEINRNRMLAIPMAQLFDLVNTIFEKRSQLN